MAALIAVAETAQDVGSALNRFLDPVADYSAEITALIAQCFHTSSALRMLHDTARDYPYPRRHELIRNDLNDVRSSLNYTFKDVQRIFGGLGKAATTPGQAYRQVWQDLTDHFRGESGNTLSRRLRYYQRFLDGLTDTLIDGSPRDNDDFEDVRDKVLNLLEVQDERLAEDLYKASLGAPNTRIPKEPSFERKRPRPPPAEAQPQPPRRVSPQAADRRRRPGQRPPPMEDDYDYRRDRHPPPAPEVPHSPSTSTSNTFSSSRSSNPSSLPDHWLPMVFDQGQPPITPFETTGQSSVSLGSDLGPDAAKRLADGYVKLLEMPFENGDLLVRLYQRPKDLKSRFLCRTIRPERSRKDCCLPLTHLIVERDGPFLKFSRVSQTSGSSQFWACLKFPSYERLVLFCCSFLALRSEDTTISNPTIPDSILHNEKELFGGKIIDDHYQHALRLYQDKNSGGIRLQASALRGDLKRTPVWTAFITHQIQSRRWMSRPSSKVIHLADLRRYIFTDDYKPQVAATGEHELSFESSTDLKDFVRAIRELIEDD